MKPKNKTRNIKMYKGTSKKYGNGKKFIFITYLLANEKRLKKIRKKKRSKLKIFFILFPIN